MSPKDHLKVFVEDKTTGEIICNCGCASVVEEKTFADSAYLIEKNPDHKNMPGANKVSLVFHDNNLATEIGNYPYGKPTTTQGAATNIFVLKKWQSRTSRLNPQERRLALILQKIATFAEKMQLRHIQTDAAYLARKWVDFEQSKGRPVEEVAATLLLIASQRSAVPRSIESFHCLLKEERIKHYKRMIREIKSCLQIDISQNKDISKNIIQKICTELQYPNNLMQKALLFLELWTHDVSVSGVSPAVRSAVAVSYFIHKDRKGKRAPNQNGYGTYRLSRERYNLQDVAGIAGVTTVSVRQTLKNIESFIFQNKEKFLN